MAITSRPLSITTRRTALALYALLLVLPTAVLGGLNWRQLEVDHRALVAKVPNDARGATQRLKEALEHNVRELVAREDVRPFYEYRRAYFQPGTIGADLAFVPSRLESGPAPAPILGWFSWRGEDVDFKRPTEMFMGGRTGAGREDLFGAAQDLRLRDSREPFFMPFLRANRVHHEKIPVPVVAINLSEEDDLDCLREELPALRRIEEESQTVKVSDFRLRFWRESDGRPRIVAMRSVVIQRQTTSVEMPSCFVALTRGANIRQGFFIDPDWVFRDLPATLAAQVLGSTQRFLPAGAPTPVASDDAVFTVQPVRALGMESARDDDQTFGTLRVCVDTHDLQASFRTQTIRFLGVAAMLIVSLATGLVLLLRSVNRDLEAARRTENFVAAVTHELRTPVAAIKLHGEMLDEGWVADPAKQSDYYKIIVRETARLETLVERVLEKSRITERGSTPEPGDLNEIVESLRPSLTSLAPEGAPDLVFDLAPDLSLVMLVPEGVRSIVTNLVENARKYAPVKSGGEPIRVVTRVHDARIVLEVLDRGPGIPVKERGKIFDAFYRIGDEKTRTSRGTGLGLHLVALHTSSMNGRVEVFDRPGGGSIFRVTFARSTRR